MFVFVGLIFSVNLTIIFRFFLKALPWKLLTNQLQLFPFFYFLTSGKWRWFFAHKALFIEGIFLCFNILIFLILLQAKLTGNYCNIWWITIINDEISGCAPFRKSLIIVETALWKSFPYTFFNFQHCILFSKMFYIFRNRCKAVD